MAKNKNVEISVVAATPLALVDRVPEVKKHAGRPKGSKNSPKVAKGIQASIKVNGLNELIVTTLAGVATYATPIGEVSPSVYFAGGNITLESAKQTVAILEGLPTWNGDLDAFLAHFVGLNASSIALVYNWAHSVTAADLALDSDK